MMSQGCLRCKSYFNLALIVYCIAVLFSFMYTSLWKNLETDSSNTARTCVSVLLDCAECLATLKVKRPPSASSKPTASGFSMNLSDTDDDEDSESQDESGEREGKKDEDELLWVTVKDGLSSPKWSVRFRAGQSVRHKPLHECV